MSNVMLTWSKPQSDKRFVMVSPSMSNVMLTWSKPQSDKRFVMVSNVMLSLSNHEPRAMLDI